MEALQRLYNRGSISTGYDIDNSLKFENDNSESLTRSAQDGGDRKRTTISFWTKRTELTSSYEMLLLAGVNGSKYTSLGFGTSNEINFHYYNGGSYPYNFTTQKIFRDTSAWYHIVIAIDTTQATDTNRVKFYVNGEQIANSDLGTNVYPSQNIDTPFNNDSQTYPMEIGNDSVFSIGGIAYSGYIAEFNFIDGSQLTPTDFGEYDEDTGIWKPKAYTGSYGTNGFYLDFESSSSLGADSSGNGNNFTLNNITSADQAVDTPTNNFAILSHAMQGYYEDAWSIISDGGTKFRCTEFDAWITTVSSIGVTKGKWYAEFQPTGARPNNMYGIASMEQLDNNSGYIYGGYLGESGESWGIGYYQTNGNLFKQQNSGYTLTTGFGSSISQNQKVGVAIDMDNHNLYIAINNTWQNSGDPTSGATGTGAISFDDTETVAFGLSGYSLGSGNDTIVSVNFGGYRTGGLPSINSTDANGYGVFRYAPPTGYYALCTKNLEEFG